LPALRVAALLAVVQALLLSFAVGRARAHVAEAWHGLSAMLQRGAGVSYGKTQEIEVNGARFLAISGRTEDSVRAVLTVARTACREAGAFQVPEQLLRRILAAPRSKTEASALDSLAPDLSSLLDGVLSVETESAGIVVCFDAGAPRDMQGFVEALRRFSASGDLSEIGQVRLVRAERSRTAGTAVMLLSSHGPLSLSRMFPERGDAPGRDPVALPRSSGVRRLLSSFGPDGLGLAVHVSRELDVTAFRASYAESLVEQGYALATPLGPTTSAGGGMSRPAHPPVESDPDVPLRGRRGEQRIVVSFERDPALGTIATAAMY
jgi:hypothetical protein